MDGWMEGGGHKSSLFKIRLKSLETAGFLTRGIDVPQHEPAHRWTGTHRGVRNASYKFAQEKAHPQKKKENRINTYNGVSSQKAATAKDTGIV